MIKKVISAAFAAMMLVSVPSFAQSKDKGVEFGSPTQEEMKCQSIYYCGENGVQGDGYYMGNNSPCAKKVKPRPVRDEYEGLNLTEAQKTQLQTLKQERQQAMQAKKEARKADMAAKREASQGEALMEQREYLEKVKSVMGHDTYVMYLENIYVQEYQRPQAPAPAPGPEACAPCAQPAPKAAVKAPVHHKATAKAKTHKAKATKHVAQHKTTKKAATKKATACNVCDPNSTPQAAAARARAAQEAYLLTAN